MAKGEKKGKGVYGDAGLPVARRYLRPPSRRKLLLAGGAALAILAALALYDVLGRGGRLISNGPLSSAHANLESNCAACHEGFAAVGDDACSTCHEPSGHPGGGAELGVYTFASHYVYRSDDFQRVVPSPDEVPCIACHVEHEGRRATITRVPDARCESCHEYAPFSRHHPEFAFAAAGSEPPASALAFPHVHHVKELMKRQQLEGEDGIERTCLTCHNPRPGGKGFEPIDFDRHCDACHLSSTDRTPPLPLAVAANGAADGSGTVGVEALDAIRRRGGPGSRWADYVSPGDFRQLGARVVKSPLYHRDPWVLYNLRRLRHELLGDGGLADLLIASPDVGPAELRTLYEEAIATLEQQALDLRSVPDRGVQQELARIEEVLAELRRRLDNPYAPLDETDFLLALVPAASSSPSTAGGGVDPASPEAQRIRGVAAALTQPCGRCHTVRDATIVRVETDLRTLRRAEFDHRAHVLQRRCLDCHTAIPIRENLASTEKVPPELDRAEIRNLPRVAVCAECHNRKLASERCVNCHLFHPDPDRRSELLLYVGEEVPNAG